MRQTSGISRIRVALSRTVVAEDAQLPLVQGISWLCLSLRLCEKGERLPPVLRPEVRHNFYLRRLHAANQRNLTPLCRPELNFCRLSD